MPADDDQPDASPDRSRGDEPDGDDQPDGDDSDLFTQFRASAESETSRLQRGPTVSLLGGSVPARVLIALGVFVVVFTVVYLALFGLLGGLGLALGWIPAAAVAFLAIQLVGRSGGTRGE